jgi:amidase
MLASLRRKEISARELLDTHVARHEQLGKTVNAVTATDLDRAYRDADSIDHSLAKGTQLGPLAGLPMTIKDGFDVENMPATAGNPGLLARDKECADAELVRRARGHGALIWGKTNVPYMLGDWQSYNSVHGTTNNPYDITRGPGGSSGGAAAAVACGITPLEIGSDIGGSLRTPASFCGVCAQTNLGRSADAGGMCRRCRRTYECDLGVGGPMARNAEDLRLLWNVLSGGNSARKDTRGLRIAIWDEDANFPLAGVVKDGVWRAARALEKQGAIVVHIHSPVDTRQLLITYRWILAPLLSAGFPESLLLEMEKTRDADRRIVGADPDPWSAAFNRLCWTARFHEVAKALAERQRMKDHIAELFQDYDAILMPVAPVLPFPHDHSEPFFARTLQVDGATVSYMTMLCWIALATTLHLPALALPSGLSADGLPVGVQLVGPEHGEDRLFNLASAAEEVLGGFTPPSL